MNNEITVKKYIDTLSLLQRDKEEVESVILGYMTDCQEKDRRIEELVTLVDKLAYENMELKAHVERLREFLKDCYGYDVDEDYLPIHKGELGHMLDETPAQSLNEIKALAIEEAVKKYENKSACDGNYIYSDGLLDYAQLLRQEK